ncbi:MAG: DUF4476 domain-containing protein [Flavobacteriales bacterium]|nr:DUF4476 domain-containing protein [Flavobacteriales bacterium]MCB9196735.1 DUF4476 domain-containing protein [Flavobacteriales bacterium]MCB9197732.1 DUF4476 domain-containing protein [Flavobacteriales bacterium]
MKRILLLFTAALLAQIGLAQQSSNLIIFAEQGTPFYAIVNGIKQNAEPETNVKITGLTNPANQIKIIFKDQSIPSLDKQIYFQEMNVEATMKISWTKKGYKLKYFGEVPMGTTTADASQNIIVYQTVEPTPAVDYSNNATSTQISAPATTTTTTVVEETTTVTSTSVPTNSQVNTSITETNTTMGTGENVSVNMNVNVNDGMGATTVNSTTMNHATGGGTSNVNINESATVTTTTTTTTTTTSTGDYAVQESAFVQPEPVVTQPVYYVDGYTGSTGCVIPESGVKSIVSAIQDESFAEDKMNVAKQATKNKCLTTDQVVEICNQFDFEEDKLDFAKYAYSRTYDVDNYYKVNKVLTYSSSKEELNEFINK